MAFTSRKDLDEYLGPYGTDAYPFLSRSCDGINSEESFDTHVCTYWQGNGSIFITHFTWDVDGQRCSVSRVDIIRIWVKIANLTSHHQQVQATWKVTSKPLPEIIDQHYHESENFRGQLIFTFCYISHFLMAMSAWELKNSPPPDWRIEDLPDTSVDYYILPYVVSDNPTTFTLPYLVLCSLRTAIKNAALSDTLAILSEHANITLVGYMSFKEQPWMTELPSVREVVLIEGESKEHRHPENEMPKVERGGIMRWMGSVLRSWVTSSNSQAPGTHSDERSSRYY